MGYEDLCFEGYKKALALLVLIEKVKAFKTWARGLNL